jgi:hypothetical protein
MVRKNALGASLRFFSASKGVITLATLSAILASVLIVYMVFEWRVPTASADSATTSVTVLNTPPQWSVFAAESPASATTSPTNIGSAVTWTATGFDNNAEEYYLLICKTSATPTANSSAPPTCGGGNGNMWARSTSTVSATQATAATTTIETAAFAAESNAWYAWICDANASLPRCNATVSQGSGDSGSPFVVNHPPIFISIVNDSPAIPGETVTWTATAYDADTLGTTDTVRLVVCKQASFSNGVCGGTGAWATSTLVASGPATTTPIQIPTQDTTYAAYVYVVDEHNLAATSTAQATNSSFVVDNVAPTVTASLISLENATGTNPLFLTVAQATTGPFYVRFTVVDNNSCLNASSTNEISSAVINVYRSGIGSTTCQNASGHYDARYCYAGLDSRFSTTVSCSQDGGSCSGSSDPTVTWSCSFSLWYVAEPTDASTPWTSENWLTSVRVTDDDTATSSFTEGTTGNELLSFLAFDVATTTIAYGGLEPGTQSDPFIANTDLRAVGNVGLNEDLYGDTMCTTWTSADSCDAGGIDPTREIPIANQKAATSSVGYASSTAFAIGASTTPTSLEIRVPKTTSTTSPETRNTYWGIAIPGAITLAGDYRGQNTIIGKVSSAAHW